MKLCFFKIILYTLILVNTFYSSHVLSATFNYSAKNISSYFSALISFDDFDYLKSQGYFKKVKDTKKDETNQSSKYIQSLISLQKYTEAENYSKNLENKNKMNFESNLILGLKELKKNNSEKAKIYFERIKKNPLNFNILEITLNYWAVINKEDISTIEQAPERLKNFNKIQKVFANCFFDTPDTSKLFEEIINDKENYSRFNFFFANYFLNKNKRAESQKLIIKSSEKNPTNLIINQFKNSLIKNEKNFNEFNCRKKNHIVAEIFYVIANALSVQGEYELSNFYINLSKYLNPNFLSYDSLLAENFFNLNKYEKSKEIYEKLYKLGSIYKWHADRQIAFILNKQDK